MNLFRRAALATSAKPRRSRLLRIEQLENRSLLATATLETFFGDDGLVQTPVFVDQGSWNWPQRMVRQADGSLLILGTAAGGSHHTFVMRMLPNGKRDTSFGDGGVALLAASGGFADSLAVQSDGKVLVAPIRFRLPRVRMDYRPARRKTARMRRNGQSWMAP